MKVVAAVCVMAEMRAKLKYTSVRPTNSTIAMNSVMIDVRKPTRIWRGFTGAGPPVELLMISLFWLRRGETAIDLLQGRAAIAYAIRMD